MSGAKIMMSNAIRLMLVGLITILMPNVGYTEDYIISSCDSKMYDECYHDIEMYRASKPNSDIDWTYVIQQYKKMCNASYSKACMSLGNLFTYNSIKQIKPNLAKSAKYHKKACELNCMISCNNLGVLYKHGIYFEQNLKKALQLFTKACKYKDHPAVDKACRNKENVIEMLNED